MKTKELREKIIGSVGHTLPDDIKCLDQLLKSVDGTSVDEFCSAIRASVGKLAKAVTAREKKLLSLNSVAIDNYLGELECTRSDNSAFEAVVRRAEKDRALKIADLKELAFRFAEETLTLKTKADAVKAILQRQTADKRRAERRSQVPDLF